MELTITVTTGLAGPLACGKSMEYTFAKHPFYKGIHAHTKLLTKLRLSLALYTPQSSRLRARTRSSAHISSISYLTMALSRLWSRPILTV